MSDIHLDFEYQPGSIANCDQPLCCRNSSTIKHRNQSHAQESLSGYWGDYRNCDVPLWTVESMFNHIAKNEQFDFVYMTGDLPPHNGLLIHLIAPYNLTFNLIKIQFSSLESNERRSTKVS